MSYNFINPKKNPLLKKERSRAYQRNRKALERLYRKQLESDYTTAIPLRIRERGDYADPPEKVDPETGKRKNRTSKYRPDPAAPPKHLIHAAVDAGMEPGPEEQAMRESLVAEYHARLIESKGVLLRPSTLRKVQKLQKVWGVESVSDMVDVAIRVLDQDTRRGRKSLDLED